jgi:hypothetical protein
MQEWVNFAITIGVLISISIWLKYYYKEGLDNTPMDVVQSQQGEIESIRKELLKLTISEDVVKQLQDDIDTTTDQINTLQTNMPDPQVKKYAQE